MIDIMKAFSNETNDKPINIESLCGLANTILKENYFERGY